MSKLFIFGIGGTGARVMRSLTMLMAAGVKLNVDAIIPIMIDPDAGNADLSRTTALMNKYTSINTKLDKLGTNHFFSTKINSVVPNNLMEIKDTADVSFANYIGLSTMDKTSQCLLKMLFSKNNLNSDMKVGFKGNPNIGSVVLNQIVQSEAFQNFSSQIEQGDKVFIINSIFGGTGASGFPLLLKILRRSTIADFTKASVASNAVVGAVTVLPYFTVKSESEETSSINSTTFISKSKSALAYYEENIYKNKEIDDLYFIGDDLKSQPYPNNEGGPLQKNKAHLIEMMAASAIVHFSNNSNSQRSGMPRCLELGLKDAENTNKVSFNLLNEGMKNMLYKPLISFTLMANIFHYQFSEVSSVKQDFNSQFSGIYSMDFIKDLRSFLNEYREWLNDMESNQRSLKFFNLDCEKEPFKLVAGVDPMNSRLFSRKNYNLIYHRLSDAISKINIVKKDDPSAFMEVFFVAISKLVDEKF